MNYILNLAILNIIIYIQKNLGIIQIIADMMILLVEIIWEVEISEDVAIVEEVVMVEQLEVGKKNDSN